MAGLIESDIILKTEKMFYMQEICMNEIIYHIGRFPYFESLKIALMAFQESSIGITEQLIEYLVYKSQCAKTVSVEKKVLSIRNVPIGEGNLVFSDEQNMISSNSRIGRKTPELYDDAFVASTINHFRDEQQMADKEVFLAGERQQKVKEMLKYLHIKDAKIISEEKDPRVILEFNQAAFIELDKAATENIVDCQKEMYRIDIALHDSGINLEEMEALINEIIEKIENVTFGDIEEVDLDNILYSFKYQEAERKLLKKFDSTQRYLAQIIIQLITKRRVSQVAKSVETSISSNEIDELYLAKDERDEQTVHQGSLTRMPSPNFESSINVNSLSKKDSQITGLNKIIFELNKRTGELEKEVRESSSKAFEAEAQLKRIQSKFVDNEKIIQKKNQIIDNLQDQVFEFEKSQIKASVMESNSNSRDKVKKAYHKMKNVLAVISSKLANISSQDQLTETIKSIQDDLRVLKKPSAKNSDTKNLDIVFESNEISAYSPSPGSSRVPSPKKSFTIKPAIRMKHFKGQTSSNRAIRMRNFESQTEGGHAYPATTFDANKIGPRATIGESGGFSIAEFPSTPYKPLNMHRKKISSEMPRASLQLDRIGVLFERKSRKRSMVDESVLKSECSPKISKWTNPNASNQINMLDVDIVDFTQMTEREVENSLQKSDKRMQTEKLSIHERSTYRDRSYEIISVDNSPRTSVAEQFEQRDLRQSPGKSKIQEIKSSKNESEIQIDSDIEPKRNTEKADYYNRMSSNNNQEKTSIIRSGASLSNKKKRKIYRRRIKLISIGCQVSLAEIQTDYKETQTPSLKTNINECLSPYPADLKEFEAFEESSTTFYPGSNSCTNPLLSIKALQVQNSLKNSGSFNIRRKSYSNHASTKKDKVHSKSQREAKNHNSIHLGLHKQVNSMIDYMLVSEPDKICEILEKGNIRYAEAIQERKIQLENIQNMKIMSRNAKHIQNASLSFKYSHSSTFYNPIVEIGDETESLSCKGLMKSEMNSHRKMPSLYTQFNAHVENIDLSDSTKQLGKKNKTTADFFKVLNSTGEAFAPYIKHTDPGISKQKNCPHRIKTKSGARPYAQIITRRTETKNLGTILNSFGLN